jgi:hypothetical protein
MPSSGTATPSIKVHASFIAARTQKP